MKKLLFLLIYFLIVGNVLISGCIDKENTVSEMSSSQSGISSSEHDYNDLPETKFTPSYSTQKYLRDQYETMKERGFPALEGVNIEFESSNMELIDTYLVDKRIRKSDTNWEAHLVMQNTGKDGVWIGYMGGLHKLVPLDHKYSFLGSGDILICRLDGENVLGDSAYGGGTNYLPHVTLDNLLDGDITFIIKGGDTITPTVSSNFGSFYLEHHNTNSELTIDFKPTVDVESIEYKVDNNHRKYVVIKVNNPTSSELSGYVQIFVHGSDSGYSKSEDGAKSLTISPGGSQTFEMCLRDNLPVSLNRVIISTVNKE